MYVSHGCLLMRVLRGGFPPFVVVGLKLNSRRELNSIRRGEKRVRGEVIDLGDTTESFVADGDHMAWI